MRVFNKKLYLRAFEYNDLPFINQLRNDDSLFALTLGNKYYISSERDKKWLEDKMLNNYNQVYLMICTIEENKSIGYIFANDIDYINRKACYAGIILEAASQRRPQGYVFEASHLLLGHLFAELGMNMIYCLVREDHTASARAAEKLGFQKSGLIRSYVYKQNKFHNVFLLTMLKSEYDNRINDGFSPN